MYLIHLAKYWLFLFASLLGFYASGQTYTLDHYSFHNGLNGRIFRTVLQDHQGFIWAGGHSGLFRYDGQTFRSWQMDLNDTTGLRSNRINNLTEDQQGRLWIGTTAGLHRFETDRVQYINLPTTNTAQLDIAELLTDSTGNVWIGADKGLFLWQADQDSIVKLSGDDKPFQNEYFWGLTIDRSGNVWIGARSGVYRLDPEAPDSITPFILKLEDDLVRDQVNFFRMLELQNDQYLLESSSGVLNAHLVHPDTLLIRRFRDEAGAFLPSHFIYKSIIDQEGFIWTATYRNKFHKYRLNGDQLIEEELLINPGLTEFYDHAISIYEDRQGNIWLPNGNGLFKLTPDQRPVQVFPFGDPVDCFGDEFAVVGLTLRAPYVWIGTGIGLFRFTKEQVLQKTCPEPGSYLHFPDFMLIRQILIDEQHRLWLVSRRDGIYVSQLDASGDPGPFYAYTEANGLPHNLVYDIIQGQEDTLWLGGYDGLIRIVVEDHELNQLVFDLFPGRSKRPDGLSGRQVNAFTYDPHGQLWMGSRAGLNRLEGIDSLARFKVYRSDLSSIHQLSSGAIKCLMTDQSGQIWIGTNAGLHLYRPESDDFLRFGVSEGLPNPYVLSLAQDSLGNYWVGTIAGTIRANWDRKNQQFLNMEYFGLAQG
ncbi:MAG: two-component regulator propeller domain-containing protein, partial [Bacteroidota bacterium]